MNLIRPNWTEQNRIDQSRQVDLIGPKWIEKDRSGPNRTKVNQKGSNKIKVDGIGPNKLKCLANVTQQELSNNKCYT